MTWADLETVLRDRGLVSTSSPAASDGRGNLVTGISYDSRRVDRGHVFVALK